MSTPVVRDKPYGNLWQYHPQSDQHSKVACWGIAFDLMLNSALLRSHVADRKVVLSVQQKLRDFSTGREKNLDLVIARPGGSASSRSFSGLVAEYSIDLNAQESRELAQLPELYEAKVGAVLVALEAKATMTRHVGALPRLYDELNSSHLTVHGASSNALSIGFSMINASPDFIAPGRNKFAQGSQPAVVSCHVQPRAVQRVIDKLAEIPRRSSNRSNGFDGLGIVVIQARNDGSPIQLVTASPAPQEKDFFRYENMIQRMSNEYDASFSHI